MIKKIIISACLFLSLVSFAQNGSSSPYSFYGIGEVRFKGGLENRSMAGIAIEQDSIHVNLLNPAGLASLKLTALTVGGTFNSTNLKSDNQSSKTQRTTLDYLAVGLPLGKFGLGFGLIPYSSVGYNIQSMATEAGGTNKSSTGSGGLNRAFASLGYKITPNLNIGASVQYNFGKIENTSLEYITYIPVSTQEVNKTDLSGVSFDLGLMYQTKINKKLTFYSGFTLSPENTLKANNTRNIYTLNLNQAPLDSLVNQQTNIDLKLPLKYSLGAGVGQSKKWFLGTQVALQDVGQLANDYNTAENVTYEKYMKYSVGGYYIPNYNFFSSYYKKITYRGGFKYEKTGLIVNSTSINDVALTLGLGLPITGSSFSNVNVGFEFGKKGTTSSGLVQENYANLSVSFSFNDKWFERRKFN